MGKHYLTCPRCDKDLEINSMFDTFSSNIDFKIVCRECWEKEQPKEMFKQIKVLEKALELACEELNRLEAKFGSAYIRANGYLVDYFKTKAKEMIKSE